MKKDFILKNAVKYAEKYGYRNINTRLIAKKIKISRALIFYYFSTTQKFKKEILQCAVQQKLLPIIAEAIILKDDISVKIPRDLRNKALKSMV